MKKILLVFKSGAEVSVDYSAKMYGELVDNLGKDHKVEAKSYAVNTKSLEGVFFYIKEEPAKAED